VWTSRGMVSTIVSAPTMFPLVRLAQTATSEGSHTCDFAQPIFEAHVTLSMPGAHTDAVFRVSAHVSSGWPAATIVHTLLVVTAAGLLGEPGAGELHDSNNGVLA
jgi:hypothetical protein